MGIRALSHAQQTARTYANDFVVVHRDRWKRDHDAALACRDLEDNRPFLSNCLKRVVELRALEVKRGAADAAPTEREPEVDSLFPTLLASCSAVNDLIVSFERERYDVAGAGNYRAAWKAVKAIARTLGLLPNPRPVSVTVDGQILDDDGQPFSMPGLEPTAVLAGLTDVHENRIRSLEEILADRDK